MPHTLIFDIGKTNKKIFIFDEKLAVVHTESTRFPEIKDEDGFPCDDLGAISSWLQRSYLAYLQDDAFDIERVNISAYGASMVYIDSDGKALTPLYNYQKPYPAEILARFHRYYGGPMEFARETASPPLQMLNSGLQVYWLKETRPQIFTRVKWALHLPQYFSFLLTGKAQSEYTSIGCHTGLWDYERNAYHRWVGAEQLDQKLPPIFSSYHTIEKVFEGKRIQIGTGIHDSSAALIPYLSRASSPFALLSTGTWNISLNPFTTEKLSDEDLQNDCLHFLRPDGLPVKAARIFLGNEYKIQIEKLCAYFNKSQQEATEMSYVDAIFQRQNDPFTPFFKFESISADRFQPQQSRWDSFSTFEESYHQLVLELVKEQVKSLNHSLGNTQIKTLYIDGGFAGNQVFVHILRKLCPQLAISASELPSGSALGAAMALEET